MKRLSNACSSIEKSITVIRDCEFDQLYLIGKPYADDKKTITFLGDAKFIPAFLKYNMAGVICTKYIADQLEEFYHGGVAISENPKTTFFRIHNYYAQKDQENEANIIAESADVHPSSIIEDNNVQIGENTVIMANVVIKSGTKIGNNCIIREGCIIGSPAFYYFGSGNNKKVVISTGTVEIGNNVELHTNVTVEKGVLDGVTVVGSNTKIDHACLIGHDVIIGENVTMAGSTTVAGGVEIGDNSFLGVGVTIIPNVKCGNNIKLSAGAVATKDIPEGSHESGNFSIPHDKYIQHIKQISK